MVRAGRKREAFEAIAIACQQAGVPISSELRRRMKEEVRSSNVE
jgi:hypothetical protein